MNTQTHQPQSLRRSEGHGTRTVHVAADIDVQTRAPMRFAILPDDAYVVTERISVLVDGTPVEISEERAPSGARTLVVDPRPGRMLLRYDARIAGDAAFHVDDDIRRYLDSSDLIDVAAFHDRANQLIGDLDPIDAVATLAEHLHSTFTYDPSLSAIGDDATATALKRGGMCRDWSHVAIAYLRAVQIPARYVAVYAPGLEPPDFHAVVEVLADDEWLAFDPTGKAAPSEFIRIATGIDANACAWLDSPAKRTVESLDVRAFTSSAPSMSPLAPLR